MNHAHDAGVVIIGAGQSGCELATALRQARYPGRVLLIGEEPHVPYRRPPLSKAFLAGEEKIDSLYIKPREAYEKHGIECMTGMRVTHIDRTARTVQLADGAALHYSKLALTTGGRPRRLPIADRNYENVHYIRTIEDIVSMQPGLTPGRHLVIIGGGYIGLETAAIAVKRGLNVTVIEASARVLSRVAPPEISAFFERLHRDQDVAIRTNTGVATIEGAERATAVTLTDGTRLPADMIVVGIGLAPNTELAEASGLQVADGIVVDLHACTSDPDIVAAGDCTRHENGFLGRSTRLESVANAVEQARIAAATICGRPLPYDAVPWFWSDQYDIKLQTVGLSADHNHRVVRGDMSKESFCVFYQRDDVLIAVDAINRPQEFILAKRLVAQRATVPAALLADESVSLKSFLRSAA